MKLFLFLGLGFIYSCSNSHSEVVYKYMNPKGQTLAAKAKGLEISNDELLKKTRLEVFQKEEELFNYKKNAIKELLMEKLIKSDKKSKGMKTNAYLDKYVFSNIKISKKEVLDFAKEKNFPDSQLNDQFKAQIEGYLKKTKQSKLLESWLAKKLGGEVTMYLQTPQRPVFELPPIGDSPVYGDKDAPVTIYEYSDFQCPHCAAAVETINKIKKKYKGKVKVVYKQYPLPSHSNAKSASIATMCVHEQDKEKFWGYHNFIFKNQRSLSIDKLKEYAKNFVKNTEQFNKCLDDKKYQAFVEAEVKAGNEVGIRSTPTFFVNGRILMGAQPLEVFEAEIKKHL